MKVLVLAGKGDSSNAAINAIANKYQDTFVILEDDVSAWRFFARRVKKLGLLTVAGQVLFFIAVPKSLKRKSAARIQSIVQAEQLDLSEDWQKKLNWNHVNSINDEETITLIRQTAPDIIVVNGTRIIAKRILDATNTPFINMHMGITPKYRGVHGGYWAVVNDDLKNCGVTVHMVSTGIDTGDVIRQARIQVTPQDNYATYPYLQMAAGIPLELDILNAFERDRKIETQQIDLPSILWSHPTLFQYLKGRRKINGIRQR